MKHKRLKTSVLLLLVLGLTTIQAEMTLNVKEKSGTSTAFVINDIQKMTFSSGNLVVTKKDASTASYAIANTRYLNFSAGMTTSLSDAKQASNKLTVYPNPVQDRLTISLLAGTSERMQLDVFSINGTKVYSQTISGQQSLNHAINVSSWQSGLYLVRLNNGRETVTTKFTKN